MKKTNLSSMVRRGLLLLTILTLGMSQVNAALRSDWELVTTTAQLTSGGTFIFAYCSGSPTSTFTVVPMRNETNATTDVNGYMYSGATAGSTTSGTIDMEDGTLDTSPYEVTIETGNANGSISIKLKSGTYKDYYIKFSGTSNHNLRVTTTKNNDASFTPTYSSSRWQLLCVGRSNRYLRYWTNSSNYRFTNAANNSGGAQWLVIYKKAACTAPNHVDISGDWDRFGGETISLTATAYSSAGTSNPIADANITSWQWQKLISSTWTNLTNGTAAGVTISGATTKNLQISNCGLGNSGKYRCIVSTGADCSTASATKTDGTEGFGVKVYVLECYTGGTTTYNFTRDGNNKRGSVEITLSASTNYTFKIHADQEYYGNNGTVNKDETNWVCTTAEASNLTVASGLGGTFTFTMDYSTGGNNSTEGIPELSITYPRKTVYLFPNSDWLSNSAKFAYYYFRSNDEYGWTDFIAADACGMSADIPQWNGVTIIAVRFNSSKVSTGNWDDKWNQSQDLTLSSYNKVEITDWNSATYNSNYAVPTYQITFAGNGKTSGAMTNVTSIPCGEDRTLAANAFVKTGHTFNKWKTDVAITVGGAAVAANGLVNNQATINNITSNITLTAQWTVNNYNLTWNLNGGTTTSAGTGIASGVSVNTTTSVAYGTSLTAPTVTKVGYTFSSWSPSVASTMPAAATTYTAQWTIKNYTVTWKVNNTNYSAGTPTDNVNHGSKVTTLPTAPNPASYCGDKFMGWTDATDGAYVHGTSNLYTTASQFPEATGNQIFYAVFADYAD